MSEDKSKPVSDQPEEMPAVRTTIVGGRPPGSGKAVGNIPRGIEILVKKAAIDRSFRDKLLLLRSNAANLIELSLTTTEKAMLDSIPENQLISIINSTKVQPGLASAFMSYTAAIMLAALGCTAPISKATNDDMNLEGGARPDLVDKPKPSTEFWLDQNSDIKVKAGIITGTIATLDGRRMRGTVYLNGKAYDENLRQEVNVSTSFESDSDGFFRLDPAPSGTFSVSAHCSGYITGYLSDVTIPIAGLASISIAVSPMAPPGGCRPDNPSNSPVDRGSRP